MSSTSLSPSRVAIALLCAGALAFACGPRTHSEAASTASLATAAPVLQQGTAHSRNNGAGLAANLEIKPERDGVRFVLLLRNETKKHLELSFPSGQTHEFVVVDSVGREIWRWSVSWRSLLMNEIQQPCQALHGTETDEQPVGSLAAEFQSERAEGVKIFIGGESTLSSARISFFPDCLTVIGRLVIGGTRDGPASVYAGLSLCATGDALVRHRRCREQQRHVGGELRSEGSLRRSRRRDAADAERVRERERADARVELRGRVRCHDSRAVNENGTDANDLAPELHLAQLAKCAHEVQRFAPAHEREAMQNVHEPTPISVAPIGFRRRVQQ